NHDFDLLDRPCDGCDFLRACDCGGGYRAMRGHGGLSGSGALIQKAGSARAAARILKRLPPAPKITFTENCKMRAGLAVAVIWPKLADPIMLPGLDRFGSPGLSRLGRLNRLKNSARKVSRPASPRKDKGKLRNMAKSTFAKPGPTSEFRPRVP